MEQCITVRGLGRAGAKPDLIVLPMTLEARRPGYEDCLALADEQAAALRRALGALGFPEDAVKTVSFNVSAEYESEPDEHGRYRQCFAGYCCLHELSLEFPLDTARLGAVIGALASCPAAPMFRIRFTVKDPDALSDALLADAAANARARAEALCRASGVRLGALLRIDCGSGGDRPFSNTEVAPRAAGAVLKAARADLAFTPENVETSDTVLFTWAIEG